MLRGGGLIFCPLLPPTWFRLTQWRYGDQGIFGVVDVESGLAFEVEEGDPKKCLVDIEGQDFNWPSNFPLAINQYRNFLTGVKQIQDGDWVAILNVTHVWSHFEKARRKWSARTHNLLDVDQKDFALRRLRDEEIVAIDDEIWKIVTRGKLNVLRFMLS